MLECYNVHLWKECTCVMCSLFMHIHVHKVYMESTCMEIKLYVMKVHVREYVGKLIQIIYDYRFIHIPYVYHVCVEIQRTIHNII